MQGMVRALVGAAAMAAAFAVTSWLLYGVIPFGYDNGGWIVAALPTILVGLVIFGQDSAPARRPSTAVAVPVPPRPALPPPPVPVQGSTTVIVHGDVHVHVTAGAGVPAAALAALAQQYARPGLPSVVPGQIVGDVAHVAALEQGRNR